MSEKRFIWKCDDETCYIFDTVTTASYFYEGIMNLLNEQQSIIEAKDSLLSILSKENEQLRKELGDCEKFRYTVFKRLNDEHIKERSIK